MAKKLVTLRCTVIKQLTIETDLSDDEIFESDVDDLRSECEDEVETSEIDSYVDDVRQCPEYDPASDSIAAPF